MTNEPFAEPGAPQPPPASITWFRAYAGFMAFLYLVVTCLWVLSMFGVICLIDAAGQPKLTSAFDLIVLGAMLAAFLLCLTAVFLPARPWVWTYDLVVICFGMTHMCCLPACIPLLIYWIKPEIRAYFGKT